MRNMIAFLALLSFPAARAADTLFHTLDGSKAGPLPALSSGLHCDYAEDKWQKIPKFLTLDGITSSIVATPDLSIRSRDDHFACRFHGVIRIPTAGEHQFTLTSDDGARLRIAGETVIDHDGPHGASTKSATISLQQGFYPIEVSYFEATEAETLDLTVAFPHAKPGPIPAKLLFHPREHGLSAGAKTLSSTTVHRGKSHHLTLKVDYSAARDLEPLIERIHQTYTSSWGPTMDLLGRHPDMAAKVVDVTFKSGIKAPAYAEGKSITISTSHLRRDPNDTIGVFIHELSHVLQDYRGHGVTWFTEGSADYVRYKLNPNDAWAKSCREHVPHDKPFDGY